MKYLRLKDKALQAAFESVVPDFDKRLKKLSEKLYPVNFIPEVRVDWEVRIGPEESAVETRYVRFSPGMLELAEEKTTILIKMESVKAADSLYYALLEAKKLSAEKEGSPLEGVVSIDLVGDER